jgi:hypothetical protein
MSVENSAKRRCLRAAVLNPSEFDNKSENDDSLNLIITGNK